MLYRNLPISKSKRSQGTEKNLRQDLRSATLWQLTANSDTDGFQFDRIDAVRGGHGIHCHNVVALLNLNAHTQHSSASFNLNFLSSPALHLGKSFHLGGTGMKNCNIPTRSVAAAWGTGGQNFDPRTQLGRVTPPSLPSPLLRSPLNIVPFSST